MKHTYIILLTAFYLLLTTGVAYSQSWQWGERGGSSDGSLGGGADEYVKDIATDENGNVYVLTRSIGKNSLSLGGLPITKNWGAFDIMLASFTCSGQLRWHKVIGCKGEDWAEGLLTDNSGGVYIAFRASLAGSNSNNLHFDTDTTIFVPNTSGGLAYKSMFLAKYDTVGNFQWVVAPQADTIGIGSYEKHAIISLDMDAQGNIHYLSVLPPGLYGGMGGYVVSQQSTHILRYNASGVFQGGIKPDIDITKASFQTAYFKRDNQLNRYYIAGTVDVFGPVFIGGQKVKGAKYIAAFNNNGNLVWSKEDTAYSINNGINGRPAIDDSGNIYIASNTRKGDEFNGYTTTTDITTPHGTVMIMKMDKDGKMIWAQNATTNGSTESGGLSLRNSGEIIMTGGYPGLIKFNTYGYIDSLHLPANSGYHPYIARFNTQTGKILGMESLPSSGNVFGYDLVSDGRNNIYIGGELGSSVTVNGKKLSKVGGTKDFFIAKYGHNNCNCTNIPEPEFTFTKNSHFDYSFTYTGTPGTMEWDLGDGTTSTQSNLSHTYTTPDLFVACVKVTNACGNNIYCAKIDTRWPESVGTIGEGNIKIYPNPANDVLTIEGQQAGTQIELFDIVGRNVYRGVSKTEKETINISHLPQGNYIIHITDSEGRRMTGKVVKR